MIANWTVEQDAWTSGNGGSLEYTIGSLSSNTSYDVQVRAENDEGISGWSATKAGVTTQNVAPVIALVYPDFSVAENSTDVATVSATDSDSEGMTILKDYGILKGGADQAQFAINDQTGVLMFKDCAQL